jgi:hypothetical protein
MTMTDQQVNRVVENLCAHLVNAIRLKGTEAYPPNRRDLGFDADTVRTALLIGLHHAGIAVTAPPPPPLP